MFESKILHSSTIRFHLRGTKLIIRRRTQRIANRLIKLQLVESFLSILLIYWFVAFSLRLYIQIN